MTTGECDWFDDTKGYGFIKMDDGSGSIFVHKTALERSAIRTLEKGQRLEFEVRVGRTGKTEAINLKLF